MPATSIALTEFGSRSGVLAPAGVAGDSVNGNAVSNDGSVWLRCRNSNGASTARTVTVTPTRTVDGIPVVGVAVSVAAGATKVLGPFPVADYSDTLAVAVSNAEMIITAEHYPS